MSECIYKEEKRQNGRYIYTRECDGMLCFAYSDLSNLDIRCDCGGKIVVKKKVQQ